MGTERGWDSEAATPAPPWDLADGWLSPWGPGAHARADGGADVTGAGEWTGAQVPRPLWSAGSGDLLPCLVPSGPWRPGSPGWGPSRLRAAVWPGATWGGALKGETPRAGEPPAGPPAPLAVTLSKPLAALSLFPRV